MALQPLELKSTSELKVFLLKGVTSVVETNEGIDFTPAFDVKDCTVVPIVPDPSPVDVPGPPWVQEEDEVYRR